MGEPGRQAAPESGEDRGGCAVIHGNRHEAMTISKTYRITKGLDLPITGKPVQQIEAGRAPKRVALVAADYVALRPTMHVKPGDAVVRGQLLFEDKKNPGVRFTSPAAGIVAAVNRGERRALQSVVINLAESNEEAETTYATYSGRDVAGLSNEDIKALLVESGLWTAFRTRPFSKIPAPESQPHSIFITAIDTNPLAPSVEAVVKGNEADFQRGQIAVAKLCDGFTYLCKAPGADIPSNPNSGVFVIEFEGVHPAGDVGVHIHLVDPVHREKTVWHIHYQDVIAIGRLVATGHLDLHRTIALAGPQVERPRLLSVRLGTSTDDLTAGELKEGENRIISGPVLSGRAAAGPIHGYLGRYHRQISVLREGREREFLGWMTSGADRFSTLNLFLSRFFKEKQFPFSTSKNGSPRAIVPIGAYERVMPMDILPTHLLRALCARDIEQAEQLGCLELDEEDLALSTFVCPSKNEYGLILRENLERIEKEG